MTLSLGSYIRGVVSDERGKPLAGWGVYAYPSGSNRVWESEDTVDNEGRFLIGNLLHDVYGLHVIQAGNAGGAAIVIVDDVRPEPNEVEIVVLDSAFPSAYLSGTLSCPWGEVPSDTVMLLGRGSPPLMTRVTISLNSSDSFCVGPLLPGRYSVGFAGSWIERQPLESFSLNANEELDLGSVELRQGGYLEISLVFEDQVAHKVNCMLEDTDRARLFKLTVAGSVARSEVLAAGLYTLSIGGQGIEGVSDTVVIQAGVRKEMSVNLSRRR
jgi:hypothetical protein